MTKQILVLSGTILLTLFVGCSRQDVPLGPDSQSLGTNSDNNSQALSLSAEVTSAQLHTYVGFANGQPVEVHRIIADWDPATTTWTNFGGAFGPDVEGSFLADGNGWRTVDLTVLIQGWAANNEENYGLLLGQPAAAFSPLIISSSEAGSVGPFLEVCYGTSEGMSCDTVLPRADVFIDEAQPDQASEGAGMLLVGRMMAPGTTKQALLRFDLPDVLFQATPSTIGSAVWEDLNQDGLRQSDEPGLPGVTISLLACDETVVAQTVTDLTGSYRFDDVAAGSYVVEFVAPAGYLFSPADRDDADTLDSDADPSTGRTECFALAEGVQALNWDAGLYLEEVVVTDSGCTRPLMYWWKHSGFRSHDDELSSFLPIWLGDEGGEKSILVDSDKIARDVFRMWKYGRPWNLVTRLYAHLLAAKLNIAAGAMAGDVQETIDQADAFLAAQSWKDWTCLKRRPQYPVRQWTKTLRQFNNGVIGPGRCD